MDFFDVATTTRAMRRLHPDPVPDEDLWTILETATMAASGGNTQPWRFVVIRDAEARKRIAAWYLDAWEKTYGPARELMRANPSSAMTYNSANHLANHLAEVPVLILVTIRKDNFRNGPIAGASIYPAVQNLMLAARALGYGTTLTTLHKLHDAEVKELLGLPEDQETMALIPLGKPKGKFARPPRQPVERVVYWEKWGETRAR
ncbi:MAG: nitroreductase family protein [Chloroflexi bacterium]|nr:nitroreductase family protein [Chloroflexota bacterium]